MEIILTSGFRRSHKRLVARNTVLKKTVKERLLLFIKDAKNPILKDHGLTGRFKGYRAFSIGYDLRAIYKKAKNRYIFFDIGTHQNVYGK